MNLPSTIPGSAGGVPSPTGALLANFVDTAAYIVPQMITQDIGKGLSVSTTNMLPKETQEGNPGHNLGGNNTQVNFSYNGTPTFIMISLVIELYWNASAGQANNYTVISSPWLQLSNMISQIQVTGGQQKATLVSAPGYVFARIVPRGLFNADPNRTNGAVGQWRNNPGPAAPGAATYSNPSTTAQSVLQAFSITWLVPLSRMAEWPFGAPLMGGAGNWTLSIKWNQLLTGHAGTGDLTQSPFGYTIATGGADQDLFTLNTVQMEIHVEGVVAPQLEAQGISLPSGRVLDAATAQALYGQRLFTIAGTPQPITNSKVSLQQNGNFVLSNLWVILQDSQVVTAAGAAGTGPLYGGGMPPGEFTYQGYPWELSAAAGTTLSYVSTDGISVVNRQFYLDGGGDILDGVLWLYSDTPGGSAGVPVPPTQVIDYTNTALFTVSGSVAAAEISGTNGPGGTPNNPQATVLTQYYTFVTPIS